MPILKTVAAVLSGRTPDRTPRQWLIVSAAIALWVTALTPAQALNLIEKDGYNLDFTFEAGVGFFHSGVDYSGKRRGAVDWEEGYLKGIFKGSYLFSEGGPSLYGALGATLTGTLGEGDAAGLTTGNERKLDWEDYYLGWKSGNLLGVPDAVDISLGRQTFVVGDGFLINSDSTSFGKGLGRRFDRGGAYWLAPRKSFEKTAIGRFQTGTPLRGDLFYLGSGNPAQGDTELAGVNLEYKDEKVGTLGAAYLRIVDVEEDLRPLREDLNTYSIRGQGSAGIENLFLSAEYAYQDSDEEIEVDAYAWYVEAGYTLANLPWSPYLGYRFSHFSGDDPDSLNKNEAFDPLFFGFSRGYGTWFQGEVAANYAGPFSSNTDVHFVALRAQPLETLTLGALYFKFITDEPPPGVSDEFAQEIDLYVEWKATENVFISPLYGIYIPDDGAEATHNTKTVDHYFQITTVVNF